MSTRLSWQTTWKLGRAGEKPPTGAILACMNTPASGTDADELDPGNERVDLIDAEDNVIGQECRRVVRLNNLLHRGVGILCRNTSGAIHVHRRTATKDVFPSLYDMFVGGVVASGEAYEDAARREIAEELGIVGPEPQPLFDYFYLGPHNCSRVAVFEICWDGPLQLQASEVAWGDYFTVEQLLERILEWEFVPDGLEIFWRYLERYPVAPESTWRAAQQHARGLR